jgi:hypothetical protein
MVVADVDRFAGLEEGGMTDDLVVLWRQCEASHDLCCEIVQLAEGEFELRVLCDGRLFLAEEGPDLDRLIDRARELRADIHPSAR